ncbi:hypothetical protein [Crateriforma spongiae]|uniref:hypothetical protein n=1 Tax=Crateriforma spongiae TaxID=2724528 RepID=UPI00144868EC|nr:hypothetical protein [Crateriforma spongiae]
MNPDNPKPRSAIERFFSGLSECVFHSDLGIADVQLVDYVSDLLFRFVRMENLHRVRKSNGEPATEVFQMMGEADKRIGVARRDVHRHIGDFTLFWSGMYPERLRKIRGRGTADGYLDYCRQGKLAYAIASEIEADDDRPSCELLALLSEQFELCAYGLREIRREWEQAEPGDGLVLG